MMIEKFHSLKIHRHTTPLIYYSTVSYNENEEQLSSTTSIYKRRFGILLFDFILEFLSEETNYINNRSIRISSYLYYIFIFYRFSVRNLINNQY
jgi:hypothetical protein